MTLFYLLVGFVILQRLLEVVYARFNERLMKKQGAIEAGASHYKWIVLLHVLFFAALISEVVFMGERSGAGWPFFLLVFIAAQLLRMWALASLGRYWNTKIIVLPEAKKVKSGPYRWIPHPNYIVVALEIASLPLIFGAWRTAAVFTIANAALLLLVRIPAEEEALRQLNE